MTLFFSRSGIEVVHRQDESEVLLKAEGGESAFSLPEPAVYSLEGDNQSGKSLLIKALLSVTAEGLIIRPGRGEVLLDGRRVWVNDLADALRVGLVAVFQDDVLIPSMTVEEQILLRHATPGWPTIAAWLLQLTNVDLLAHAAAETAQQHQTLLSRLFARNKDLHPAYQVRTRAVELLARYGYSEILRKYPRELSGGAKAVARLVQAQLTPGIRLLCLDEAFAGVDERTLPGLVEKILDWQQESQTAVLVVTHNAWERQLWNPRQSFRVRQRQVISSRLARHDHLISGLPARGLEFQVFVHESGRQPAWLPSKPEATIFIVDKAVNGHPATEDIRTYLEEATSGDVHVLELNGGEENKTFDNYALLLRQLAERVGHQRMAIVIAGGGSTLNAAGFVAATLHRGRHPTYYVPTTVMAIADVAVGSKTGVNLQRSGMPLKHTVGAYHNPSAVIIDGRYIESLSTKERLRGLSECLKHGLLQDPNLFQQVTSLVRTNGVDTRELLKVSLRTLNLKSRVLRADPLEEGIGRLLLYGHLHAHSIERALGLTASHGDCVYLGLLIELYLTQRGQTDAYTALRSTLEPLKPILYDNFILPPANNLELAYAADHYDNYKQYRAIEIPQIGYYSDPSKAELCTTPVEWSDIRGALEVTRSFLES